jgi:hypothetical protein
LQQLHPDYADYVNGVIDMADTMVQKLDTKNGIDRVFKRR